MRETRTLHHPETGATITVFASAVSVHVASGWQPVTDEPEQAAAESDARATTEQPEGTASEAQDKPAARSKRRSTESSEE